MDHRKILIPVIFLFLLFLFSGCGSGGNSGGEDNATPTSTAPSLENGLTQGESSSSQSKSVKLIFTPDSDRNVTLLQSQTYTLVSGKLRIE